MRKTVTKGDKKRRREVNEEIAKMEKEIEERHARQLQELEERVKTEETVGSKPVAEEDHLVEPRFSELSVQESKGQPKVSKAQKRRVSPIQLRYGVSGTASNDTNCPCVWSHRRRGKGRRKRGQRGYGRQRLAQAPVCGRLSRRG